jgi:hypothetical protein
MTATLRDRYAGWKFEHLPDGSHRITTPEGVRRHYSQETAAEETVNLIHATARGSAGAEEQLDLWRRVVGEDLYRQALSICGTVASEADELIGSVFEFRPGRFGEAA